MQNFSFYNPAKIIFGKDTETQCGEEIKRLSSRILMVYGGGSIKKIGLYEKVLISLKQHGVCCEELCGVQPNPRLSLVQEGIRMCREHKLDAILAVGGGSVIDTAKAIAVGVPYNGNVWDFYEGKAEATEALPIGVVLTIPAAGSESSDGSVITKEEGQLKRSYGTSLMIPKFAIMNPEFTYSLPAYQVACGASDILAHLMERYFTQVSHVDYTSRLLEASMRTILDYAPLALEQPENYDIRAEVMWVGTVAHNNLLHTGRIGDWASHQIEHEISGIYDIAHGAGLAIVFPAWMKYVYRENIDLFVQFAVRVLHVDLALGDKELVLMQGIRKLEQFFRLIGMPVRLSEAGICGDRLREMADKCCKDGKQGNFKQLDADDVYEILKLAE